MISLWFADIFFNITLRRRTLFYTVNLIIPTVGISYLSVLVITIIFIQTRLRKRVKEISLLKKRFFFKLNFSGILLTCRFGWEDRTLHFHSSLADYVFPSHIWDYSFNIYGHSIVGKIPSIYYISSNQTNISYHT